MSTTTPSFTPETARSFDRYSVANAVAIREALSCDCQPYQDVFTYRRWQAQGYQVQRGQRSIRLPLVKLVERENAETGKVETRRLLTRSAVFCRCQVQPSGGVA